MNSAHAKQFITELAAQAGLTPNGSRDFDPQIHDERFYRRILKEGSLGLGESYMDGWWDCKDLGEFFNRILRSDIDKKIRLNWNTLHLLLSSILINRQRGERSYKVGEEHYDIGNDLYETMLDKRMTYTCGYWKKARDLDEAQEHKLDLACKKIGLKKGDRVLDIGCGWGSFAIYAAENYGAEVVGLTISRKQQELGMRRVREKNLPVDIRLQDYREIDDKFDHLVSLGMIEHVGYKNYRTYMEVASRALKDDGLFLLHTIGSSASSIKTDPWIEKYIFPNSMIPSAKQLTIAMEGLFKIEDWHNFGVYYDKTLLAWHDNVMSNWSKLKDSYNERFRRMWEFYLLVSAGSFRSRNNHLWQIVLSKNGIVGGYESIR